MRLISLPDLHLTGLRYLDLIKDELASVDLIVLPGDLTNTGKASDTAKVVESIQAINPQVLAVVGNWDSNKTGDYLTSKGINLNTEVITINDLSFGGIGGCLPYGLGTRTEYSETEYETQLQSLPSNLTVFVSHQPPFNCVVDFNGRNKPTGSHAIRAYIERNQPLVCLTGHMHDAVGMGYISDTTVMNPGPIWNGKYGYAEIEHGELVMTEIRSIENFTRL